MIVLSLILPSGRWKISFAVDFLSREITETFKCEKNSSGFSSLSWNHCYFPCQECKNGDWTLALQCFLLGLKCKITWAALPSVRPYTVSRQHGKEAGNPVRSFCPWPAGTVGFSRISPLAATLHTLLWKVSHFSIPSIIFEFGTRLWYKIGPVLFVVVICLFHHGSFIMEYLFLTVFTF